MNRTAARCEPLSGRDLELVAAVQAVDRLHKALAERVGADDERAVMVLQRTRDDLRRGGRATVDQDDEWNVTREMLAGGAQRFGCLIPRADAGDLLTVFQEKTRRLERLFD